MQWVGNSRLDRVEDVFGKQSEEITGQHKTDNAVKNMKVRNKE